MSQSIERIWKEGFLDNNALVAPKVNNLYEQKSQNVVDKLQRMFDINLKVIMIVSLGLIIIMPLFGLPWLGAYIALLLMTSVMLGKQQLKSLAALDKNNSSYQYILDFRIFLDKTIREYTLLYRFIYPLLFVGCVVRMAVSSVGQSIIVGLAKDFPAIPLFMDVPIILPILCLVVAFMLSYFASAIYKADMDIVYGKEFKKLNELIADMEALRS